MAFSLAASILTIIELSTKVISKCFEYSRAVKHATDDIERVREEITNLGAVVKKLHALLRNPHGARLHTSQELHNALESAQAQLRSLHDKLTLGRSREAVIKIGLRSLRWPFESKEVDKILQNFAVCIQTITIGLETDQT